MNRFKRNILKEVCESTGIDVENICESKLYLAIVQLSKEFRMEIIVGSITAEAGDSGELTLIIQPKFPCATCMRLMDKPQTQIIGLTQCCRRIYCKSCVSSHTTCRKCGTKVCAYCGEDLRPIRRGLVIHKGKCFDEMINSLENGGHLNWITYKK